MSISIITTPENPNHGYSPAYYVVSSTNSGQTKFKYVVDVYEGIYAGNDSYVGRFKFPVRTDGTAVVSCSRILESYLTNKFVPTATAFTQSYESQHTYKLYFGEEFLVNPSDSGTTIYSGLTNTGLKNYNNSVDQYVHVSLSSRTYYNGICNVLTDWNVSNSKRIRRNEYETIDVYRMLSNTVLVETYDSGFTQIGKFYLTSGFDSNVDRYIVAAGTKNLNYSANNLISLGTTQIIPSNCHYYTISMALDDDTDVRSSIYGYLIQDDCLTYEPVRIAWLNQWGGHDYFGFNAKSINQSTRKNNEWEQLLGNSYQVGERGRTNLSIDAQNKITVSTDWINDAESEFIKKCFLSPEHFMVNTDGTYYPLILVDNQFETKTIQNDKLFSYQLTFEYAYQHNTQRT